VRFSGTPRDTTSSRSTTTCRPPEESPLLEALEAGNSDSSTAPEHQATPSLRNPGPASSAVLQIVFKTTCASPSRSCGGTGRRHPYLFINYNLHRRTARLEQQRISQVAVEHQPAVGRSGYSLAKLLVLPEPLHNFSLLPLQSVSLVALSPPSGLGIGAYYVLMYFLGGITVPGYASTISAILILAACNSWHSASWESIWRLHLNVNRKPQYTVPRISRQQLGRTPEHVPVDETDVDKPADCRGALDCRRRLRGDERPVDKPPLRRG